MSSYESPDPSETVKNLGKDIERAEGSIYKDEADLIPGETLSPDDALYQKEITALAFEAVRLDRAIKVLPEGDAERQPLQARLDSIYAEIGQDFDFVSLEGVEEGTAAEKPKKSVISKMKEAVQGVMRKEALTPSVGKKIVQMKDLLAKVTRESKPGEPTEIEKMRAEVQGLSAGDGKIDVLERRIQNKIGELKTRIKELKGQMAGLSADDGRVYVNNLRIKGLMAELPAEERMDSELAA